ncbi:hypothetical protein [Acetobacter fallax]|uniref:Uncharacterized protein n=1 Tax=Acetobacter fallax TaxID=1737473 RepID=A0ABX0KCE5_9PROT|nr:hypothetical protein [Acetobacter fallax]NHO32796.1 hypothetical protein [Acetobacter fallax]NHO36359.1 hypothetical protein [Acetobacter fallax]
MPGGRISQKIWVTDATHGGVVQAKVSSDPSSESPVGRGLPSVVVETTFPEESVTVIVMVPLLFIVSVVVSEEEDDAEDDEPEDDDELADDVSNRLETDEPERPEMEEDMV